MVFTSPLIADVATCNVDLAIEGLADLIVSEPPDDCPREKLEWAHFLCTYTRYVHLNTWSDQEPIQRVREEFIPEFMKAEACIMRLIKQSKRFRFTAAQVKRLRRYKRNITKRKESLSINYLLEDCEPDFDPGAIDPS